jgi:hypothetical protein
MTDKTSEPNSSFSTFIFACITIIYIVVDHSNIIDPTTNYSTAYLICYILSILTWEFYTNISLTTSICGSVQWRTAITATVFPWGLIFGIFILLLTMFPGWLTPFSNTFGYAVVRMQGINSTLVDILAEPSKITNAGPQTESMNQALAHIYSDKSLLVNEITPENFEYFWKNMKNVIKESVYNDNDQLLKKELYSFVVLKYSISKFVWYMLIGFLITSVSFNYIANSTCQKTASDMQKHHEEYEQQLAEAQTQAQNAPDKKVYTTTE